MAMLPNLFNAKLYLPGYLPNSLCCRKEPFLERQLYAEVCHCIRDFEPKSP